MPIVNCGEDQYISSLFPCTPLCLFLEMIKLLEETKVMLEFSITLVSYTFFLSERIPKSDTHNFDYIQAKDFWISPRVIYLLKSISLCLD